MFSDSAPISSPADFLASHTVSPGSEPARAMTARSGRKCAALLRTHDPLSCLVRTCLESSRWNSTACLMTWNVSATPRGRLLFRLVPWTPDTDETEFGLWPTPKATTAGADFAKLERSKTGISLQTAVRLWPTPTKQDGENNAGPSQWERNTPPLNVAVKMWQTPRAEGFDAGKHRGKADSLHSQVKLYPTPMVGSTNPAAHNQISGQFRDQMKAAGVDGPLNPQWVEWLMGYPHDHTACEDSETPSSRKSRKR